MNQNSSSQWNWHLFTCLFGLLVAGCLLETISIEAAASEPAPEQQEKPNIVIILADDLGYGDTSPFNPDSGIPTPNFERLASQGMIFTDAHSGSGVCTPTRYGLVCGRYAWRTRLKRGVLAGYSKPLIDPDQQTIGGCLQTAGYHTCVVGKWHLGLGWQWKEDLPDDINNMGIPSNAPGMVDWEKPLTDGPLQHGFNNCFLFPASLDMSPYVYIKDSEVTAIPDTILDGQRFPHFYRKGEATEGFDVADTLDDLTAAATGYIKERSATGEPFFLYFPLTAPHKPVSPHERFVGSTELGLYGDFIHQVDSTIGEVVAALEEAGVAENTLLVVTSDNGSFMYTQESLETDHVADASVQKFNPDHHRANGHLRGTKADVWEAGHRVPFYVRWPAGMADGLAGSSNTTTICHTDLLATCCAIAGVEFDSDASPDSFDYSSLIVETGASFSRPPVVHHSAGGTFAIRKDNWKLVLGNGSGGRQQPRGTAFERPYFLFDLEADLAETNNLIESQPEIAAELQEMLIEIAGEDLPEPLKQQN
ncbi:MAG: arylsulfatase [Planctomycetota bacterium]